MNKADAQNYLYPLLNEDEKIAEGIKESLMTLMARNLRWSQDLGVQDSCPY